MLDSLIRYIFRSTEMEEHFARQEQQAEGEVRATQTRQRMATRKALSPLCPDIQGRYEDHLARTGDPVLAEMASIRDSQESALARAFSVLDF